MTLIGIYFGPKKQDEGRKKREEAIKGEGDNMKDSYEGEIGKWKAQRWTRENRQRKENEMGKGDKRGRR